MKNNTFLNKINNIVEIYFNEHITEIQNYNAQIEKYLTNNSHRRAKNARLEKLGANRFTENNTAM